MKVYNDVFRNLPGDFYLQPLLRSINLQKIWLFLKNNQLIYFHSLLTHLASVPWIHHAYNHFRKKGNVWLGELQMSRNHSPFLLLFFSSCRCWYLRLTFSIRQEPWLLMFPDSHIPSVRKRAYVSHFSLKTSGEGLWLHWLRPRACPLN